jgi:hypothetical protein
LREFVGTLGYENRTAALFSGTVEFKKFYHAEYLNNKFYVRIINADEHLLIKALNIKNS